MARARKKKKQPPPGTSQAAVLQGWRDVVPVCWLVSLLTVVLCVAGNLLAVWAGRGVDGSPAALLGRYLLLAGALVGVAGLVLTPLAARASRVRPPRPLVWIGAAICATPLVWLALVLLR